MRRARLAISGAVLVMGTIGATPATAGIGEDHLVDGREQSRATTAERGQFPRGASLEASTNEANEGDLVTMTAVVKSPAKAIRVTLQKEYISYYGDRSWIDADRTRARGGKATFEVVATGPNSDRYRVSVAYKGAKPRTSKAKKITVWRWIPLTEYRPYYSTSGTGYGEATINGRRYKAWGSYSYSQARAWEGRFTPGRNCKAFHAVLGVGDISDDGSSANIILTADDTPIYESPALTPGMEVPVDLTLDMPYRYGIQMFNTSAENVKAWPVVGEPAFLCTGV